MHTCTHEHRCAHTFKTPVSTHICVHVDTDTQMHTLADIANIYTHNTCTCIHMHTEHTCLSTYLQTYTHVCTYHGYTYHTHICTLHAYMAPKGILETSRSLLDQMNHLVIFCSKENSGKSVPASNLHIPGLPKDPIHVL